LEEEEARENVCSLKHRPGVESLCRDHRCHVGEILSGLVIDGVCGPNEVDLSHLYHNTRCFNAHHLHFEHVNLARICNAQGSCRHHGKHPDCVFRVNEDKEMYDNNN